jgi:actin-like ATPase involved in cell morphogenesis
MKNFEFAISIGSSVTSIYKAGVGVVLNEKSVVVTGIKGKREIALHVGDDAFYSGIEYRKVINDGVIDFTLAELMISEFIKKVELKKKDGVIFLVSMEDMKYASDYKNLGYACGINNVEVIPSIIATAYGYEIDAFKKFYLLVDIGVNTEIAIVNNGRIINGATIFNGGNNIDVKIANYIYQEKGIELSKASAEKVKNEIATLLPNDERSIDVEGFIKDTTEYATATITSTEIFDLVVDEYSKIANGILQILVGCENEINQDIKKHGIYLCGASSKITGLDKFLMTKLNLLSYKYKPDSVTMIGVGQLLDSPLAIEKVLLENVLRD